MLEILATNEEVCLVVDSERLVWSEIKSKEGWLAVGVEVFE